MSNGKIIQVIGPVVDVEFGEGIAMPALLNALHVKSGERTIVAEVARHLEPGKVRAVAMATTDGVRRGDEVTDTGKPISVPVGPKVLGNIFDVLGNTLNDTDIDFDKRLPIHRN